MRRKEIEITLGVFSARLYGSRSRKNRELIAAMKTAAEDASRP